MPRAALGNRLLPAKQRRWAWTRSTLGPTREVPGGKACALRQPLL